jgi:HD-like signal output (HDOD) protein
MNTWAGKTMGTAANLPWMQGAKNRAYAGWKGWWGQSLRRALPVLPNTLFRMNAVLSSSPVNLGRVVAVAGDDPALAANLLRESRTVECDQACDHLVDVMIGLGVQRLQALLLRMPLLTSSEAKSAKYLAWRAHSGLSSVLAETIAGAVPGCRMARIAGLLHDIGELPLVLRSEADQGMAGSDGDSAGERQASALHCDVGHELARTWGFSEPLTYVIREHHGQDNACPSVLAAVVAADRVSHRARVGIVDEVTRAYADKTLEEIIELTLPWLTSDQQTELAANVRHTYELWRRSHRGVATAEI